ncbi:iron-containing alcohol dehydrogenase [Nocardioides sambongensis]|uniref:iron-containing alcohol dehydrogenase n=1 Tax=Nocardioides sambongensis TaxID=2589074 RepID=UPI0022ABC3E2|nr:iron-containing alcohol dehydrogenase [Nocardioides sambongensis]
MGALTSPPPDPGSIVGLPGRTFVSPARYVQGPGVLGQLGAHLAPRHSRVTVLVDAPLLDRLGPGIEVSLEKSGIVHQLRAVQGEVTPGHIEHLASDAASDRPSAVVGVGGGKVLDLAKGVSRALRTAMVSLPTIASNDGPTSRVIAMYNEDHLLVDTPHLSMNPELVLVDTQIICSAPPRFLRSGIGDALAKYFEARACRVAQGKATTGQEPLAVAGIVAAGCRSILVADAEKALASLGRDTPSPELERTIEAVVLLSGLAFENGGLSMAHALTRGLMITPGADRHLHGYHVAYGLLVQLAHEGDTESLAEVAALLGAVELPQSLHDLDVDLSPGPVGDEVLQRLAMAVTNSPHVANCVPAPTTDSVVRALTAVEALPRQTPRRAS